MTRRPLCYLLLGLILVVAVDGGRATGQERQRVYGVMPIEDARGIVRTAINKTVNPASLYQRWSAPENNLYARGLMAPAGGYIVFAAAASDVKRHVVKADGSVTPTFHTNGVLITSLDLEVIGGHSVPTSEWVRNASGAFVKARKQQPALIPQGVYEWLIAPSGIMLSDLTSARAGSMVFLEFEDEIPHFAASTRYLVDLTPASDDPSRFTLSVAGKKFTLR